MAEAAELEINRSPQPDFDWDYVESQFQCQSRTPESEIYGRSLSTIFRLGAFMVGKSLAEIPNSPEAEQARVEFYTSVEEGFGTDLELGGGLEVRDFDTRPVANGKVMAKNGVAVSKMTQDGLVCALETYANDQRFLPQLIRSEHDHANALQVDQMVQGKTDYNTRIIVSPYPKEAADKSGEDYWRHIGYVPHLERGFVQLYHVTEEGELLAGSLSFDGSNKQRLFEVFAELGIHVPAGEVTDNWLKYAITDTMSSDHAKKFATMIANRLGDPDLKKSTNTVDVTGKYHKVMDQVFDESYIHVCESLYRKRQTSELIGLVERFADKAQHFNERYKTALYNMRANPGTFTDDDSVVLHELLVYSTIEMMRALHLGTAEATFTDARLNFSTLHMNAIDPALLQQMLGSFGAEGAKNNRVYSACGTALDMGGDGPGSSPQEAYGGNLRDNKEESTGKKMMNCPFCRAKVFDDPCAKVLSCWDCRATVVNGKVVSKGDGGSKARAAAREAKREAERTAREVAMTKQVDEVFADLEISENINKETSEVTQQGTSAGKLALAGAGV